MSNDKSKLKLDHLLTEVLTKKLSDQEYKEKSKIKKHKKHKKTKKKYFSNSSSSEDDSSRDKSRRYRDSQEQSRSVEPRNNRNDKHSKSRRRDDNSSSSYSSDEKKVKKKHIEITKGSDKKEKKGEDTLSCIVLHKNSKSKTCSMQNVSPPSSVSSKDAHADRPKFDLPGNPAVSQELVTKKEKSKSRKAKSDAKEYGPFLPGQDPDDRNPSGITKNEDDKLHDYSVSTDSSIQSNITGSNLKRDFLTKSCEKESIEDISRDSTELSNSSQDTSSRRAAQVSNCSSEDYKNKSSKRENLSNKLVSTKSKIKESYSSRKYRKRRSFDEEGQKSRRRSRSRSQERRRSKYDERDYRKSSHRPRDRSPHQSRSQSQSSSINKERLLEVARKNALNMMKNGAFPENVQTALLRESASADNTKGKSVKELTDFCRNLSKNELNGNPAGSFSTSQDSEQPFIVHPFKVKEASSITLNIRNSVQIPVKSHAEKITENARTLTQQFPVSSGNHHRQKLLEWVPVEKDEKKVLAVASTTPEMQDYGASQSQVFLTPCPPPPTVDYQPPSPMQPPPPPPVFNFTHAASKPTPVAQTSVLPQNVVPVSYNHLQSAPRMRKNLKNFDVQSIVVKHYNAREKLAQDPSNADASRQLNEAILQMQEWVSCQQPLGQYTGSSEVRFLTAEELSGPKPAWLKRHVLLNAAPVSGGKGMSLLKKMGWNPGEGLGKNKEGALEPLILDIKTDKKGLTVTGEKSTRPLPANSCNKHPVSVLMELCSKKKWLPPSYTVIDESGPSHKRCYRFCVEVNGRRYQPALSRQNKKLAKAEAATMCLQDLRVDPSTYSIPSGD